MKQLTDMFSRNRIVGVASVCAAMAVVFAGSLTSRAQTPPMALTVYKSAGCACCESWIEHMRAAGFKVASHDVPDLDVVDKKYRVPAELGACHTAVVDGYVIEGHVPADVVKRLLTERPKVIGIAVPGMPVGAPGMDMPGMDMPGQKAHYEIISFDQAGQQKVYERR